MNQYAYDFVRAHEGCSLVAYRDQGGIWTIGYGHTGPEVTPTLTWTQAQADTALARDLMTAEAQVRNLVHVSIGPQAIGALTSFVFNLGQGALAGSDALKAVNRAAHLQAARLLLNWDHIGQTEIKGLLIRRLEEAALYLKGV